MKTSVRSAAGLVWRHQRLVWWIFAANLGLAWLASLPVRITLHSVLDHSMAASRMVTGFDLGSLGLLLERPDVQPRALSGSALAVALLFLAWMLFLDGGIFAVFLDDRKLSRAEFFENCGLFLWRMMRLALYSLVPFAAIAVLHGALKQYGSRLSSDAPGERTGFYVQLAAAVLVVLLALAVRMWFDLAQAWVVRDNERKLLRILAQSLKMAFGAGRLMASYAGIALFALVAMASCIALWLRLPHSAMLASFLLLELLTVVEIASRLWMKAASARWFGLQSAEAERLPLPSPAMVAVVELEVEPQEPPEGPPSRIE